MAYLPGAPEPGEFSPAFAAYIGKAQPFSDPVEKLSAQLEAVLALLYALPPEKRLYRYDTGKWSVQEMVCHITDTERIFAYRLLRIARGDTTPLAGFEENAYVAAAQAESCDWDELTAEFAAVRNTTVILLRHLPDAAWGRSGTVNGAPLSVRALAYILAGHVEHHLGILLTRYL